MNAYETAAYGKRFNFVYLRYAAVLFFLISQLATYFVVSNALTQAANALNALNALDVGEVVRAVLSLKIPGEFGQAIAVMRNLGSLVIPMYFIATISFVLNMNRRQMGGVVSRTALVAVILCVAEFIVYAMLAGGAALIVAQLFSLIRDNGDVVDALNDVIKALNAEGIVLPAGSAEDMIAVAENFATDRVMVLVLRNVPSFNIFLDQLLCLLMCVFLGTRPKRADTRVKLALFRSLSVIPIGYILAAFILNGLTQSGVMAPDLAVLSAFPAKRLPHFLFVICILICNRMHPVKTLTPEKGLSYAYLPPKKSFKPSPMTFETPAAAKKRARYTAIFLSAALILLCAMDFCLGYLPFAAKWGLGKSYYAVFCIPFLFPFDDRKPASKRQYSVFSFIYFLVIVAIVLIYMFA